VGEKGERTFAVHIQSPLQSRKQGQKCLSETSDGSALVNNEVAAASEEKLQFGELFFTWLELTKVRPHPSLVGNGMGISGIGFRLTAVGVAGSVYAEARDVENSLVSLPQQC
jgi:hypothetical protein